MTIKLKGKATKTAAADCLNCRCGLRLTNRDVANLIDTLRDAIEINQIMIRSITPPANRTDAEDIDFARFCLRRNRQLRNHLLKAKKEDR